MNFIFFNVALDTSGFHILLLDFVNYGALLRIGFDADQKFFGLHLFGFNLIMTTPQVR